MGRKRKPARLRQEEPRCEQNVSGGFIIAGRGGTEVSYVTIQLCGSAGGLSYLHSLGIVHGSGESDMNLTKVYDLTLFQQLNA